MHYQKHPNFLILVKSDKPSTEKSKTSKPQMPKIREREREKRLTQNVRRKQQATEPKLKSQETQKG